MRSQFERNRFRGKGQLTSWGVACRFLTDQHPHQESRRCHLRWLLHLLSLEKLSLSIQRMCPLSSNTKRKVMVTSLLFDGLRLSSSRMVIVRLVFGFPTADTDPRVERAKLLGSTFLIGTAHSINLFSRQLTRVMDW